MVFGPEGEVLVIYRAHTGFQFPLGIRWCSDEDAIEMGEDPLQPFNSLWELDDVRTP